VSICFENFEIAGRSGEMRPMAASIKPEMMKALVTPMESAIKPVAMSENMAGIMMRLLWMEKTRPSTELSSELCSRTVNAPQKIAPEIPPIKVKATKKMYPPAGRKPEKANVSPSITYIALISRTLLNLNLGRDRLKRNLKLRQLQFHLNKD
jgi:hypothetical protein